MPETARTLRAWEAVRPGLPSFWIDGTDGWTMETVSDGHFSFGSPKRARLGRRHLQVWHNLHSETRASWRVRGLIAEGSNAPRRGRRELHSQARCTAATSGETQARGLGCHHILLVHNSKSAVSVQARVLQRDATVSIGAATAPSVQAQVSSARLSFKETW